MAPTFDIIVVGGGAIGAACARELAATGRSVLVLETGRDMGQAWRAAGGMLAPQIEADGTDPLLSLAWPAEISTISWRPGSERRPASTWVSGARALPGSPPSRRMLWGYRRK